MRANMPATLPGSSLAGALLVALSVVPSFACTPTSKTDGASPDGGPSTPASAPLSSAALSASALSPYAEAPGSDELKPVYPTDAGPPDPLAARFCDAVVVLGERRRGECCTAQSGVAEALAVQCVRTLTFALGQKAVSLAPADVDRCVEAMTRSTTGCDWVTTYPVALPPECDGVVKGALQEKAPCRSSLECVDGLRCLGLSTIDPGVCGPPKGAHEACNLAVDMLATFARQDHMERTHPECVGYCNRGHCDDVVAEGGACTHDRACRPGWCSGGKCTRAPLPSAGEACINACAPGARCVKGKCAAPKAAGADCELDAECRGACVRGDGGTAGTCTQNCPVYTIPPRPPPSAGPGPRKPARPPGR
jgi:hypothetical protein